MIDGGAAKAVSGLIQTALAPMFLLAAIGTTLAVIDTRLNRIVDRARALDARLADRPAHAADLREELAHFMARARNMTNAVMLCTLTALTVAGVVVLLFVDLQTRTDLSLVVEGMFTLAVLLYVGALAIYLRDAFQVRVGLDYVNGRVRALDGDKP